jgi:hypothetical protein
MFFLVLDVVACLATIATAVVVVYIAVRMPRTA